MGPQEQSSSIESENRRIAARLQQDVLLDCNLGDICDLSRTGVRIRCKSIPTSSLLNVDITDGSEKLTVQAIVVWVNKLGFRKFEIGLQFQDLDPQELQIVSKFAMYNRFNRSM